MPASSNASRSAATQKPMARSSGRTSGICRAASARPSPRHRASIPGAASAVSTRPPGNANAPGREPAVGVALEKKHLQSVGGVTRENDRGRFAGNRGLRKRLGHDAGRITPVSASSTAWIDAVLW